MSTTQENQKVSSKKRPASKIKGAKANQEALKDDQNMQTKQPEKKSGKAKVRASQKQKQLKLTTQLSEEKAILLSEKQQLEFEEKELNGSYREEHKDDEVQYSPEDKLQYSPEDDLIHAKTAQVTKGMGLGEAIDLVDQSFNQTEKLQVDQEEWLYDNQANHDNLTEGGKPLLKESENQFDFGITENTWQHQLTMKDSLTPEVIKICQQSWEKLETNGLEQVGTVLFKNIFKLAPEALQIFQFKDESNFYKSEIFLSHAIQVVITLREVVNRLDHFQDQVQMLQELGFKHAQSGILAEHYPVFGQALLSTLKAGLKEKFTTQVKMAWKQFFEIVSKTMLSDFYTNSDILSDKLTDHKINIVQESWVQVAAIGIDVVGPLLFRNLFEYGPELITLFNFTKDQDWENSKVFQVHYRQVFKTVNKAIQSLRDFGSLVSYLKNLGRDHMLRGVNKEHYGILSLALQATLKIGIGNQYTFELQRAWQIVINTLAQAMITTNYNEQEEIAYLFSKTELTEPEKSQVVTSWRKVITKSHKVVGQTIMKHLFLICPEIEEFFDFTQNLKEKDDLVQIHGEKVSETITKILATLGQAQKQQRIFDELRSAHSGFQKQITGEHMYIFKEAVLTAIEEILEYKMSTQIKFMFVKVMKLVRNQIMMHDPEEVKNESTKMTIMQKRVLQYSSDKFFSHDLNTSGPLVFKHLFELFPASLQHFPFKNQKGFLQSAIVKKQTAGVLGIIRKGINCLDSFEEFEKFSEILNALGHEHRDRSIDRDHYNCMTLAIKKAIEQLDGPHFDPIVSKCWELGVFIISEKMIRTESYDFRDNLERSFFEDRTIILARALTKKAKQLTRTLDKNIVFDEDQEKEFEEEVSKHVQNKQSEKLKKGQMKLVNQFRNEVDFHHKIYYKFEKAYRIGKQKENVGKKKTLNLEIIDCIGNHQEYIQADSMSLFYLLFFCIFFRNKELTDFIRQLISRAAKNKKLEQLLQQIDVHGIEKIRTVGEAINKKVYHMVLYQAIEDNLRIVYASILRQLRFVQLRDQDALHLLNQRDYDLIEDIFGKHPTKINMEELGYSKNDNFHKCHSYRKFNQAFFEEIVIDYNAEERVAQNYRERFLVTAEDTFIVFEMYCNEDYDQQFVKTKKSQITHDQFIHLFVTCMKQDSPKISMLIYLLYMNPQKDVDEKMMDVFMLSIKESVKYHEIKLFFIHEHFDKLNVQQMNQLIEIYSEILHRKDIRNNPMLSQFNTIKVSLLIYRICWKIEQKEIYSLITKCSLLQSYLVNSLTVYFKYQNNILTLQNFMLEPILSLDKKKDSLDIMYEMNLHELLKIPVVIEVLDLVNEGKFSINSSSISMSQTFDCAFEMKLFSEKSMTNKLLVNIANLGNLGGQQQAALQYNIWKQSIDQRQNDEMVFTTLFCFMLTIFSVFINQVLIYSVYYEQENFGQSLVANGKLLSDASPELLAKTCPELLSNYQDIYRYFSIFNSMVVFYAIGLITKLAQKLTILNVSDNVSLNATQLAIEILGVATGYYYWFAFRNKEVDTLLSSHCKTAMEIASDQSYQMDKAYTLLLSPENQINFKFVMTIVIVQLTLTQIKMLQKTESLGKVILMFEEMLGELRRFFQTFGLILGFFFLVGLFMNQTFEKGHKITEIAIVLDLFRAFNGHPNFQKFTPIGQIYIGAFLVLFKIMLLSLLSAMFINKYKVVWKTLNAKKRFNIISLKNSHSFDKFIGGVTITFFPFNVLSLIFIAPVIMFRSNRMSEFILKIQYSIMILVYCLITILMVIPMFPILQMKLVVNAVFIFFTRRGQSQTVSKSANIVKAIFLGPFLIMLSLFVDLLSLPSFLFKESSKFEHKYWQSEERLNDAQITVVMTVFKKMFYGSSWEKFKNKRMSLIELMIMHYSFFDLVNNLHDLTCRGNKDFKEALAKVQDYNMTKILTRQCAIPNLFGVNQESKVEFNILQAIQFDIEAFNFIDVLFRKEKMGTLAKSVKNQEDGVTDTSDWSFQNKDYTNEVEQDIDIVIGTFPIQIGPDGLPLYRNNSDVMNNFWVNFVARSFTNLQLAIANVDRGEKKRLTNLQKNVAEKKVIWQENLLNKFNAGANGYENLIRKNFTTQQDFATQQTKTYRKTETPIKEPRSLSTLSSVDIHRSKTNHRLKT